MDRKIYITRRLPDEIVAKLSKYFLVEMWEKEDTPVPRSILEEKVKEVDGLFCLLTEAIDRELLDQAKNLKVISNMAVGYNNIDINYATQKGIMVTNTPGVLTETTADLTFSLLMATSRRLLEADQFLRQGKWKTWSPFLLTGQDVFGSTLGIIGLGQIGKAVARRAKGFNMEVLYYNRSRKFDAEQELGIHYTEFEDILRQSDFLCILVPFTKDTENLISRKQFSLMKDNAVLVNTSRGGVVNEDELYNALVNGDIWAAGLDVFNQEPTSIDHPLISLNNVITLPHIGSASYGTRMRMAYLNTENLIRSLAGDKPVHLVNEELSN
ncbi:2-hydroxyacid dehydrogenase [Tuberibacillus sp. Marseille-P3662]|uniref:2-hydroxyacid dehydrogenase n=1 Tax=Tuberibacillus sp. Marseille-P3662 TaxID=1965358 RepID=UPI000A1CE040|nr:D-glycerate dehydrogenase [Tuberibacillus sp. Marseille-P3662]